LAHDLVAAAYARVDLVERRGEFAVRGGIVDVFPPGETHPVRIDFFGDDVEDIRHFSVADQRSTELELEEVVCDPCRELLLDEAVQAKAAALIDAHPELSEMLEHIAQGQAVEGMEALTPALVDELELLLDVMPADTLVLLADPELVETRSVDLVRTSQEFLHAGWAAAASEGKAPIDLAASGYRELDEVREHALGLGQCWWGMGQFAAGPDDSSGVAVSTAFDGAQLTLDLEPAPTWHGDADAAVRDIAAEIHAGTRVVISLDGRGLADRLAELLRDLDIGVTIADSLIGEPEPNLVQIITAGLPAGFLAPQINLALHTGTDIAGATNDEPKKRKLPAKRRNQVVPLELKPGDPLVHEQHGVGRFIEMVQRTVAGATREYLVLEYAPSKRGQPGDRLYVPMDQLDQVTRYVGSESPQLDKMGGADWRHRKSRARKAVHEVAAELIKLYAARQATRGFAFSPDTPWQRELEDAFAYVETPDQLTAINDVKRDMERVVPMDRLISGDVGYGKT
jgi:transcription-repair coupling factor (superfamily II helicase)